MMTNDDDNDDNVGADEREGRQRALSLQCTENASTWSRDSIAVSV